MNKNVEPLSHKSQMMAGRVEGRKTMRRSKQRQKERKRRRGRLIFLLLLLLLGTACWYGYHRISAEIDTAAESFMDYVNAGDAAGAASLLDVYKRQPFPPKKPEFLPALPGPFR